MKPTKENATQVGKYKFNSSGVCENPDVILQHKGNAYEYQLVVFEGPAGWMAGCELMIRGTAVGCGYRSSPPSKKGTVYFSKKIASIDVANIALEFFGNNKSKELDPLRALISSFSPIYDAGIKAEENQPDYDDDDSFEEELEKVKYSIGNFNYNEHGCCLNPDIILDEIKKNKISYELAVCENKNGWVPSVMYTCNSSLTGSGAGSHGGFESDQGYATKDEAILAGAKDLIQTFKNFFSRVPQLQSQGNRLIPLYQLIDNISSPNTKTMAKQTAEKSAPPGPIGGSSMLMIPISSIIPSPTNKLHREYWELDEKKDPTFADLVQSIKTHDVFQPVLLRVADVPGKYFLVCGERRFTAAKIAGRTEIPANIKTLNDDQAFELQIIENLQRKDVHPLKEGESYKAYMDQKKATIDDLVAKFSKTRDYIMQRISFNALIPELKRDFYANKMGPGHAALFARLTPADQMKAFQDCKINWGAAAGSYKLIDDVKQFIHQSLMMTLTGVSWDLKDADLVPAAGSCAACPKRSGAGLFNDVAEKDRCFDGACFKTKMQTFAIQNLTDLLENNPDMPVIKLQNTDALIPEIKKLLEKPKRTPLVQWHDYDQSNPSVKGAVRALIVAGTSMGRFQHIKIKKQAPKLGSSPSATGPGATAPVTTLQSKIESAKREVEMVQEEIAFEVANETQKKLFDFKPYKSADPKPLTKYELAAFFMSVDGNSWDRALSVAIKGTKVPGMKPSANGYTIEQFANMPQELKNWLMRVYLKDVMDELSNEDHVYLTAKLAEENKAVQIPVIKAAAEKKFEKKLQAAQQKLMNLKNPPAAAKPGIKSLLPKKSTVKN